MSKVIGLQFSKKDNPAKTNKDTKKDNPNKDTKKDNPNKENNETK